ncbi:hypothetical protein Hanom_Chr13g01184801 [Helianthus anomalus]
MEIEDWADGSSDLELPLLDSDNEDNCYAYGDLPKLRFRWVILRLIGRMSWEWPKLLPIKAECG